MFKFNNKDTRKMSMTSSVVGQYKHATVIINRIRVLIGREMLIRVI